MLLSRIKCVPVWMSASVITSFNAMVFGLDTGTIGPVTTMTSFKKTFGEFSATVHGVIVSSILIGGVLTSLFSGILADRYGRPSMIALGSLIFGIGAALEATAFHLPTFVAGRLVKGIGEGIFLSTVYVLVAELSPAKRRGTVANIPQLTITVGLLVGLFMCYGTARGLATAGSLTWRLPLAVQAALALTNSAATWLLVPQSPRWLLAQERVEQAREVIAHLGLGADEQEELLLAAQSGASGATGLLEHGRPGVSLGESVREALRAFGEAFSAPVRARTAFGCFIMTMQQFSGIDGVLYYAPILFAQAGLGSAQAGLLASGVNALVLLVVTVPATLMCDMWGRKTSSVVGGALISALMLIMGSLYAADRVRPGTAASWVVIVSIYLFGSIFHATWALSFRMYMIESLPRKTRSSGASLGQASNWLANYVVALSTPVFLASSSYGAYYFFAFCSLFCTVMCAVFMFETKGHSLEFIEQKYSERQQSRVGAGGVWCSGTTAGTLLRNMRSDFAHA